VAEREHLVASIAAMRETAGMVEEPDWLWGSSALALTEGRWRTAWRLVGGAEALSRRTGSYMNEQFFGPLKSELDEVAGQLGADAVDRLRAEGARMTLAELVAEAVSQDRDTEADDGLSAREREVAELVARGLTNSEIAERLFISRRTVDSHLDHIRQKLGLRTRRQVMAWVLHGSPAADDR
jgi:DNA-binding CsgD family transcriptional regulator